LEHKTHIQWTVIQWKTLFLLFTAFGMAQSTELKITQVDGKIVSDSPQVEGVNIIVVRTEMQTQTDKQGYFSIPAQVGDTLVVSAVFLRTKKWVVQAPKTSQDVQVIYVQSEARQLKEVYVNKQSEVSALGLAILSQPAKKYTVAERRLNEATTGGGIVPLNPILNALSGRTKMLKKELVIEEKERCIKKLEQRLTDSFYTDRLKIPKPQIRAFFYYVVELESIRNILKGTDKTTLQFALSEEAPHFLALTK
jgi:hypothetical protein